MKMKITNDEAYQHCHRCALLALTLLALLHADSVWPNSVLFRLYPVFSHTSIVCTHNFEVTRTHAILEHDSIVLSLVLKSRCVFCSYFDGRCRVHASAVKESLSFAQIVALLRDVACVTDCCAMVGHGPLARRGIQAVTLLSEPRIAIILPQHFECVPAPAVRAVVCVSTPSELGSVVSLPSKIVVKSRVQEGSIKRVQRRPSSS